MLARYAWISMARRDLDAAIDRLYQLPLAEFTAARNALAKEERGDAAQIRALEKPVLAAWAVNQLYWKRRDVWEVLTAAAERLREAHRALLAGRKADRQAASETHEDAMASALTATLSLVEDAGYPATDAMRHAIATTLRALPGPDRPGRLVHPLQPGGFEMLAGLSIAGPPPARAATRAPAATPTAAEPKKAAHSRVDARALARAREAVAAAERTRREAERALRRDEFESASRTREAERAAAAVEKAREALSQARAELDAAEAAAKTAVRQREAARARAKTSQDRFDAARSEAESAAAALKKIDL